MADAPEIKVKLTAEDTGVSAAIKELTSQLKTLKTQQSETAASSISLSNALQGIGSAAALIGFVRIGKEALDSAITIGKMADKTGLTTQTLSVFHHVADESAVSTEQVDKGLIKAAKSIVEFQQGSVAAAKGFELLHLKQKDFIGLKPDAAIKLLTERFGQMAAGSAKATAAQLIFSRGGAELIPVMNAIAAEGFDKVTASAQRLGLLLDQKTTDAARAAKASLAELAAVGKGMATQFEAGLLPAITDVAGALTDSLTQGGVSFVDLGRYAGDAIKGIALVFLGLGQTVGTVLESMWDEGKTVFAELANFGVTQFEAISLAAHGHIGDALKRIGTGARDATRIVTDEVHKQIAIYGELGKTIQEDYSNLFRRPAPKPPRRDDQTEAKPIVPDSKPSDAAAKATLAFLAKQLEDELALLRAHAKQAEQIDTERYDKGEISLRDYYNLRRAEVTADAAAEAAVLQKGMDDALAQARKAAVEKSKATTPKEADKEEGARIEALKQFTELQTKSSELRINADTKIHALDTEEFKKTRESQLADLEFQKKLAEFTGKKLDTTKQEIALEVEKRTLQLQQEGKSQPEIDAQIDAYTKGATAAAEFTDQQKLFEDQMKSLADQKAAIEDRVKDGQLFQIQADNQILDLERQRLAVLKPIADNLTATAKTPEQTSQAEGNQKQVAQIGVNVDQAGQHMATLKKGLQDSITGGFGAFFDSVQRGTRSIGNSFRSLAASVVGSLEKMATQMLINIAMQKLLGTGSSGGGAGGGTASAGGGIGSFFALAGLFAEGGLIKGPGGPKSDSIAARVSPGEFIVKADAVSMFGAHNLEAINRGLKIPSLSNLSLPKFEDGGLVGGGSGGGDSNIRLGIGLDEGLIMKHLSTKAAGKIILEHLTSNPKAANHALSRSQ